mmetsp:Transcript_21321/g.49187  ORF Transcript_21321/g.49187 Transcript_21321/m.49187 type:complete len:204 (-) Transcript_21321:517-1128(-)
MGRVLHPTRSEGLQVRRTFVFAVPISFKQDLGDSTATAVPYRHRSSLSNASYIPRDTHIQKLIKTSLRVHVGFSSVRVVPPRSSLDSTDTSLPTLLTRSLETLHTFVVIVIWILYHSCSLFWCWGNEKKSPVSWFIHPSTHPRLSYDTTTVYVCILTISFCRDTRHGTITIHFSSEKKDSCPSLRKHRTNGKPNISRGQRTQT